MAYSKKSLYDLSFKDIQQYIEKHSDKNNHEIARVIIEDHKQDVNNPHAIESIRKRVARIKSSLSEGRIPGTRDTAPKVDRERYIWNTIYGAINIPVNEIDELFYEYSRHGLNMSQTAIINKHNLEAWQWQSIKRKLQLVKDSNIFSPHTVSKYKGEQLKEMIEKKIDRKYEQKGQLVEEAYKKQTLKAYEKVIHENEKKLLEKDIFYNEVMNLLPKAKIVSTIHVNKKAKTSEHVTIPIADLHLGARVEHVQNTPNYNPDILEKYLNTIAKQVNDLQAKKVTLIFLGDLIESFTGLNHKNSWKGIEYGYFGSTVVIKTVELLTRFISKINNVVEIVAVSGNHDRTTSDKGEDTKGEVGELVFYILNMLYKNKINVNYHPDVVSTIIDGINYIITHGHLGESKKSPNQLIVEYGNNKKFNLILEGHLHSRIVKEDGRKFRFVICPSLFTGNSYSKQLGFSSTPGYLQITNNGNGYPNITDITL
jgi:predicted phosphodiesterase/ribosomal protein L29